MQWLGIQGVGMGLVGDICFSLKTFLVFKPRHMLVARYYFFTLVVRVCVRPSLCLSVVRPSVRTSFSFDNFSIYKRIPFKLCIWIHTNTVSLEIVNGQILIIYPRVMKPVNARKMFFASSSFPSCCIMMKLYKIDRSNKICIAQGIIESVYFRFLQRLSVVYCFHRHCTLYFAACREQRFALRQKWHLTVR